MVLNECDRSAWLVVVIIGEASIHMTDVRDGDRLLIQRLKPGATFGTTLLSTGLVKYPAMLTSVTRCELLFHDLFAVRSWLDSARHPAFLSNLFRASAKDGYFAWRKLMLLSCYRISDRVLLFLRWRREDGNRLPYHVSYPELAETLGVNRTALYRAVAELKTSRLVAERDGILSLR